MAKSVSEIARSKEIHLIEYFLPFYILLSQYSLGVLSSGSLFLIVIGFILIARRSWKVQFPAYYKPFALFLAYIVIRDVLRLALGPDPAQAQFNRIIEYLIIYFLVFVVCTQNFSEDKLFKVWKIAGVIFTLGLIIQVIQINVLQSIAPISIIPGYSLRPEGNIDQMRPSSFFAEPAAYVNAMTPLEFMALRRKDFKWAIFSTIAILLTGSTVGVILSIVLWTLEMISRDISFQKRVSTVIISGVIIFLFMNYDIFNVSLTKLLKVASGESTFGSRVLTGFEIIRRQSIFELIIGTNYNDVATFVSNHISEFANSQVVMVYWRSQRLFLNTFSRLIFQYGIIGLVLFLYPLILYLKQPNYKAKNLIRMVLIAIFGQTMLFNAYYFMMIILLLLYERDSLINNKESLL